MSSPKLICRAFVLVAASTLAALGARAEPTTDEFSDEQWIADLEHLVEQIEFFHPGPYTYVEKERFDAMVASIIGDVPTLTDQQTAVRIMQLVAHLDGHSKVQPRTVDGFEKWFPVRFYGFADGIAIMTIDKKHADLVGATVVRYGGRPIEEAQEQAVTLLAAENEFGKRARVHLLSNSGAMHALGVIEDPDVLALEVVTREGETRLVELGAIASRYSDEFWFHGEYIPPQVAGVEWASPFPGKTVHDLLVKDPRLNTDLPLHVRTRKAYWYQPIEGENAMYMQINVATPKSRHSNLSFAETYLEMFEEIDRQEIETLVVDIRWHVGGDGGTNGGFIRELIKREGGVNHPGRLFVLTGPRSYSAACTLIQDMVDHTHTTFVGEPAGQYGSMYGDPAHITLPNTGISVAISTLWWQGTRTDDLRNRFPVDIPVPMKIGDYFAHQDPLLDAALDARARETIFHIATTRSVEEAVKVFEQRRVAHGDVDWWGGTNEDRINDLAYELLRAPARDQKSWAVELFRINTVAHPRSWNAWDSYGDGLAAIGRKADAADAYERALETYPGNWNAGGQRAAIQRLRRD
ncbi:MAG: hypothetical protein ACYTGC_01500 [Planctomycetota bacterium]|jgi:hypothetical protein